MKNMLDLEQKKIGLLMFEFSLPAIIGMLVGALYNVTSRAFLGKGVGTVAIAAITIALPMQTLLWAVMMLVAIGTTSLISIRLGEKKIDEAEKIISSGTTILILIPSLLTVIYFLFANQILTLFGASPEVLPYARSYTDLIMLGSITSSISFGMNNFIRAEGNPRIAMATQIMVSLLNIFFNYIFIFPLGMGIRGSALAVVVAQSITALFVLAYYLSGRSLVKIRIKYLFPRQRITAGIFAIGFAPFSMQIAGVIQQTILNQTVRHYGGDLALSTIGILISLSALIYMPIMGLGQGAQPILGFNYGARAFKRVKRTLKLAIISGTGIALASWVIIIVAADPILRLFSNGDVELTKMTSHAMKYYFALIPYLGFQIVSTSYFQATGKPVQATILSLSRQVLIFIPLLLILPHIWGINGVWRAVPISDALACTLTSVLIYFEIKNINYKEKNISNHNE